MKVSFDGIGAKYVTFEADSTVKEGSLVKLTANGKVAACVKTDVPLGVASQVRDGICAVQTEGYMLLPCASGVTVGYGLFALDDSCKAAKGTTGRPGFVLYVDSAAGVCGMLF